VRCTNKYSNWRSRLIHLINTTLWHCQLLQELSTAQQRTWNLITRRPGFQVPLLVTRTRGSPSIETSFKSSPHRGRRFIPVYWTRDILLTCTHARARTHKHISGLLMPSEYWGQLFIVQVVSLWSALHTWCCVSRPVHCTAYPHCGCRHVWLEYLLWTFLRHLRAVNPDLNMLENLTNGDLSIPAVLFITAVLFIPEVLLSQKFSLRTTAIS
jgi:hypothetical protein